MANQAVSVQLIPANQFETEINLGEVKTDKTTLARGVEEWINSNRKFWPDALTAHEIVDQIPLRYLPYWDISGHGTATWYASIGVDRQVMKTCGTCGGRGRYTPIYSTDERRCDNCAGSGKALGTETFWNNQSGHAEGTLDGRLFANFDEKSLNLHIGKRDFGGGWSTMTQAQRASVTFIAPIAVDRASARKKAENALIGVLEADAMSDGYRLGNYVSNVKLANTKADNLTCAAYGYPLYWGEYLYDGVTYAFQADAVTGKFWLQKPKSVEDSINRDNMKLVLIMLGVAAIALLAFFLYSRL